MKYYNFLPSIKRLTLMKEGYSRNTTQVDICIRLQRILQSTICQTVPFTRTILIFFLFTRIRKSEKSKKLPYLPKIFCTACLMTVINSVRPIKGKTGLKAMFT